jgi:dihydroorotase
MDRRSGVMLRLLRYAAMLGMTVITHAEDAGITGDAVATAGEMATRLGLPSAPSQAEAVAVARDIALAEMAGAALHFRQITTKAALDLIRAAKAGVAHHGGRHPGAFHAVRHGAGRFPHLLPPVASPASGG